jgi:hypothetical protein
MWVVFEGRRYQLENETQYSWNWFEFPDSSTLNRWLLEILRYKLAWSFSFIILSSTSRVQLLKTNKTKNYILTLRLSRKGLPKQWKINLGLLILFHTPISFTAKYLKTIRTFSSVRFFVHIDEHVRFYGKVYAYVISLQTSLKFCESSPMSVISSKAFEMIPDQISALCEWYDMWTYKQAEIVQ